jgi:hypothetical protein
MDGGAMSRIAELEAEFAEAMRKQRRLDELLRSLLKPYPTRVFLMASVSHRGLCA